MKSLKSLVFLSFFVLAQCANSDDSTISLSQLENERQEILDYINGFDCTDNCNYIALGAKPCGGPREYLLFPSSVNLPQLQEMVDGYHELDSLYNIQTGAISDCAVVLPPENIGCVNGDCIVID